MLLNGIVTLYCNNYVELCFIIKKFHKNKHYYIIFFDFDRFILLFLYYMKTYKCKRNNRDVNYYYCHKMSFDITFSKKKITNKFQITRDAYYIRDIVSVYSSMFYFPPYSVRFSRMDKIKDCVTIYCIVYRLKANVFNLNALVEDARRQGT